MGKTEASPYLDKSRTARPANLLLSLLLAASPLLFAQDSTSDIGPVTSGLAQTCFPQDADPNAARLVKATLQTRHGDSFFFSSQGSAVVIANSADKSGLNAILTVAHNLGSFHHGDKREVTLTASDNTLIGVAVAVAIPWRYHPPGTHSNHDIAVLRIKSFASPEAEKKYRAIQGIGLAPIQARSGYVHGLVTDPVPPSYGSSGAPIVNAAGQLIGLADHMAMRSAVRTVSAIAIGAYAELKDKEMVTPIEGRTYGSSVIEHSILKALGPAGQNITLGAPPLTRVTIASYPGGYCAISHGVMAPVTGYNAATLNFDTPAGQQASFGSFNNWQDPEAAYNEVIRLLIKGKVENAPGTTQKIDLILAGMAKFGELKPIPFYSSQADLSPKPVTIDTITDLLRTLAKTTNDPALAKDFQAASERLPISLAFAHRPSWPVRTYRKFFY